MCQDDYLAYISYIVKLSMKFGLTILGWCLMPNHIHLIAVPENESSMANTIGKTHGNFTLYANKSRGTSGHLWENRYYSCPMDEAHLIHALRYVDRNPVRAGLAKDSCDYMWSSAVAHSDGTDILGLIDLARWNALVNATGILWSSWVEEAEDEKMIEELRKHTINGTILTRGQAHGFCPTNEV